MMKHLTIVFSAAVLLAWISCKPENVEPKELLDGHLTASMEQMLYKSGPSAGDLPVWSENDRIAVFTDAGPRTYTLEGGAGTREAMFTGPMEGVESLLGSALAPAEAALDEATVRLPSSYETSGSRPLPVLRGENVQPGGMATFRHLGGMVKIVPDEVPAAADALVMESDCRMTGDFTFALGRIDAEAGKPDRVVCRFNAGNAPSAFFIPVPVGTLTLCYAFQAGNSEIAGTRKEAVYPIKVERRSIYLVETAMGNDPSGKGTQTDPYVIRSKEQWASAAAMANADEAGASAWYALDTDLDLSVFSAPSFGAVESLPFKGHFDGRGHTVSNLVIMKTDSSPACPFLFCNGAGITGLNFRALYLKTNGGYCAPVG